MADEQKPTRLEPPKDIEELLKEFPKIDSPQRPIPPQRSIPPPPAGGPPPPKPLTLGPPPSLTPPLKPIKPILPPPRENEFKSLVRTMDEDLEAAKKGLKPESKPFEIKPPPGGPRMAPPLPPLIPPSGGARPMAPEIKLGPAERTKPLEIPKPLPPLPPPGRKFSISPKFLIVVLVILAVFAGVWYFLARESEEIIIFTPTPTPTPPPKTLSQLITSVNQITISSTENFLNALNNKTRLMTLTAGEFTHLIITNETSGYSISEIFERLNIAPPSGVIESLDGGEWMLFAYGQQEMFDAKGILTFSQTPKIKLGLVAKTNNPDLLRSALNSWEVTMTNDLKNLFNLNAAKAASQMFLDNIYGGADIRYRNFPFADSSIDYAIVNLPRFNLNYFVITNSRESAYSAVDLLQNQ